MKNKTLNRVINSLLFEADVIGMPDMVYGIYDRPGPKNETDPEFKPTVQPEIPLKPTELMSNQLAVERPPIEDDDYAPTSVSDLRQAASAIAGLVPPDQVEKFYRQVLELLDKMEEEDMSKKVEKSVQVAAEEETSVKSESVRRIRRQGLQALIEALGDENLYSSGTGERLRSRFDPKYAQSKYYDEDTTTYDPEEDELEPPKPAGSNEDAILNQLAMQFGYKGPSGLRQALMRLFELMKYLITNVGAEKMEDMMGTVVPEYIDLGVSLGYFEKEDGTALKANPVHVRKLDSFRNYFNFLYRPVYQKLRADKEKEVRHEISKLGIPEDAIDSVYFQLAGASARKDSTIAKQLVSSMPAEDVKKTLDTISTNFNTLKKRMSQIPNDLLGLTHKRVKELGEENKRQMFIKSFEEAGEFQEQFGESRQRRRARR